MATTNDEFLLHEALDRTHVAMAMFDEHVLTHPSVAGDPVLKAMAEKIQEALGDLYQKVGEKRFNAG